MTIQCISFYLQLFDNGCLLVIRIRSVVGPGNHNKTNPNSVGINVLITYNRLAVAYLTLEGRLYNVIMIWNVL